MIGVASFVATTPTTSVEESDWVCKSSVTFSELDSLKSGLVATQKHDPDATTSEILSWRF